MMIEELDGVDITTNGRTTWVNIKGMCRGRFCKISAEYADEKGSPIILDMPPDWSRFLIQCKELFGIAPERFTDMRPHWVVSLPDRK